MKYLFSILIIILLFLSSCLPKKYVGYVITYKSWDYALITKNDSTIKTSNSYILKNFNKYDTIK